MFYIDGKEMLPPDEGLELSFEDIDSAAAGRDELGYMHRRLLRQKVGKWSFCYAALSAEQYRYMESLFAGKATFAFTYPDPEDPGKSLTAQAYRASHSISWYNARTGRFRNYKFSIISC